MNEVVGRGRLNADRQTGREPFCSTTFPHDASSKKPAQRIEKSQSQCKQGIVVTKMLGWCKVMLPRGSRLLKTLRGGPALGSDVWQCLPPAIPDSPPECARRWSDTIVRVTIGGHSPIPTILARKCPGADRGFSLLFRSQANPFAVVCTCGLDDLAGASRCHS